MRHAIMKSMIVMMTVCLAPSSAIAIGISTILCDNNSADWIGFRKKSTLFFSPIYEMRPKKNLWVELTEGEYCEIMQSGRDSFSCQADINGTKVTTLVDFDKPIYIKIINDDKTLTYNCIEID
ncbi:hypothetical protein [Candidatus Puniceispirillum sp.]|uniref:hypothetical protein n=1 Tax=Candidatus Puniceispirillum sp. TaxID=2026719 RepID=UPI003F698771